MLTFHVFSLWAILLHVILCISPATLVALANYHSLKARAVANAVNLKARNKYNAALSKSKTNLAQLNKGSKSRTPRHVSTDDQKGKKIKEKRPVNDSKEHVPTDEKNNKSKITKIEEQRPMDDSNEDNRIDQHDYLVDDTFMIHERTSQDDQYAPYAEPVDDQYQKFQIYGEDLDVFPENMDINYLNERAENGGFDMHAFSNGPYQNHQKAAFRHHKPHHHQHGFVHYHTHEHGIKPIHEIEQHHYGPPPQPYIENQQTVFHHQSRLPLIHPEPFGGPVYGGNHPPYGGQKGTTNSQVIINQNQVINENILKAQQAEQDNEAFQRIATSSNEEIVSTFDLHNMKSLDSYAQYESGYPEPYYYSPLDFDPKKADNKQPLVKYIDDQEKAMKHLLENIELNNKNLLDYDKKQKKYLLEYEKEQKKYVQDYENKQKNYLKEFEENRKKSLLHTKKDKLHVPKDPQNSYPNNYNMYGNHQPSETYAIPLPPSLPHYEIKNDQVQPYQTEQFQNDLVPQIPSPYNQDETYSPEQGILYNGENHVDSNHPLDNSYDPNSQYSDPFYSWVSQYPGYGQTRDHSQLGAWEGAFKRTSEGSVAQATIPLENAENYDPDEFDEDSSENAREAEQRDEQILTELLVNHPGINEKIDMTQDDPRVEYIFQVPYQNDENYKRHSRSVDQKGKSTDDIMKAFNKQEELLDSLLTFKGKQLSKSLDQKTLTAEEVENILKDQKDILNSFKSDTDEGLQLIQNIGNNLVSELEGKLNKIRVKRQQLKQEMLWNRSRPTTGIDQNIQEGIENTFNKVGSVIKHSIQSGREALTHVADIGGHAKKAVYNTKHSTPRVISRARSNIGNTETVVISPKLVHIFEDNRVGATTDTGQDFIKFGDILDAVGASDPHNNLKYQKIILRSKNPLKSTKPNRMPDPMGNAFNPRNNDIVGDTLNTLQNLKKILGANTLKEFFMNMKRMLKMLWNQNMVESKFSDRNKQKQINFSNRGRDSSDHQDMETKPKDFSKVLVIPTNNYSNETVGNDMLLPDELLHPFMKQPSQSQIHEFFSRYNKKTDEDSPNVGAINRGMLERIYEEINDKSNKEKDIKNGNETLATSMTLQGNVLKPFLGQLKNKKKLPVMTEKTNYNQQKTYISELPVYTYSDPQHEDESYEETIYL